MKARLTVIESVNRFEHKVRYGFINDPPVVGENLFFLVTLGQKVIITTPVRSVRDIDGGWLVYTQNSLYEIILLAEGYDAD